MIRLLIALTCLSAILVGAFLVLERVGSITITYGHKAP